MMINGSRNRPKKTGVTGPAYHVFAEGVRRIVDPGIKQHVADHFAKYFAGRSPSFDPQMWFEATGGLVNRKVGT